MDISGKLVHYVEELARSKGAMHMEITVVNIRDEWLKKWYARVYI